MGLNRRNTIPEAATTERGNVYVTVGSMIAKLGHNAGLAIPVYFSLLFYRSIKKVFFQTLLLGRVGWFGIAQIAKPVHSDPVPDVVGIAI